MSAPKNVVLKSSKLFLKALGYGDDHYMIFAMMFQHSFAGGQKHII